MKRKPEEFEFSAQLIHRALSKDTLKAETVKDRTKTSDRWHVLIDGFGIEYSKGVGLRDGFKLPYRATIHEAAQFDNPAKSKPVAPTVREVLQSLASDASCYLNSRDVDDFATEFGYEKPSEAIKAWEACARSARFFQERGLLWEDYTED